MFKIYSNMEIFNINTDFFFSDCVLGFYISLTQKTCRKFALVPNIYILSDNVAMALQTLILKANVNI